MAWFFDYIDETSQNRKEGVYSNIQNDRKKKKTKLLNKYIIKNNKTFQTMEYHNIRKQKL